MASADPIKVAVLSSSTSNVSSLLDVDLVAVSHFIEILNAPCTAHY
jgi:hypothetical protein